MQTGVQHDNGVGEDIGCVCEGEGGEESGGGLSDSVWGVCPETNKQLR